MGRFPASRGLYAIEWAQTEAGDEPGLSPDQLMVGMEWRWHGDATRLDGGAPTLWLDRPLMRETLPRLRARRRVARVFGRQVQHTEVLADPSQEGTFAPAVMVPPAFPGAGPQPPGTLTLTDGHDVYQARLVHGSFGQSEQPVLVFDPLLPPPGKALWIIALNTRPRPRPAGEVLCFLPGTLIATPEGPQPVETLRQGARVLTADNGAQPVVWRGETRLSAAELLQHPEWRPLRLRAGGLSGLTLARDLLLSPGHRVLLPAPGCLFTEREVLARAVDLEDGRLVSRDDTLHRVHYIHLMFERHQIVWANGQRCESFHPALTAPEVLRWHARTLERAHPGITRMPERLGAPARRCLTPFEARLIRHGLLSGFQARASAAA